MELAGTRTIHTQDKERKHVTLCTLTHGTAQAEAEHRRVDEALQHCCSKNESRTQAVH